MFQIIKATALGGLMFLIPVIILIAIFEKAHQLVGRLAAPILAYVPVERVLGIVILDLLTIAFVLLICFLAGLAATTPLAIKWISALESEFLSKVPAYDVVKTKLTAQLRFEQDADFRPVLARFDDQWQMAFEVDRIADGYVVVFLPGAPDAWSGSVSIVTEDRITPLDSKLKGALGIFKHLGKGAGDHLKKHLEKS